MKIIFLILALAGYSSLSFAGTDAYSIKPFIDASGKKHCCEVTVHNGKEIGCLKALIKANADGSYEVHLEEKSVKALEGQRITAGATSEATMNDFNPFSP